MGGLQRRAHERGLAAAQRQGRRKPYPSRVQLHTRAPSGIHGRRADGRLLERTAQQRRPRIWRQRYGQHGGRRGAVRRNSRTAVFAAPDAAAAGGAVLEKSEDAENFVILKSGNLVIETQQSRV